MLLILKKFSITGFPIYVHLTLYLLKNSSSFLNKQNNPSCKFLHLFIRDCPYAQIVGGTKCIKGHLKSLFLNKVLSFFAKAKEKPFVSIVIIASGFSSNIFLIIVFL